MVSDQGRKSWVEDRALLIHTHQEFIATTQTAEHNTASGGPGASRHWQGEPDARRQGK